MDAAEPSYVLSSPGEVAAELPEDGYRKWLANRRFPLAHRTRKIGPNTIAWHDLIDPDDGEVMGQVREHQGVIAVKLNVRTVDPKTGKPGCNLRDTFACEGSLADAGPWVLGRVPPCRKGCEFCVAPDTLTIDRAPANG